MTAPRPIPIIDSHIHLYAESHIPTLSWTGDLPPDHVLNRGNTVDVYRQATSGNEHLAGFVFLETDRKSGLEDDEWEDALAEAAFLSRIAQGKPNSGEGHKAADSKLVLGVVPWAPVPAGTEALARYVTKVWALYPGDALRGKVKGFRYLLQDKAPKVMLQDDFIAGLIWLGRHDLSFDLGVDARSAGLFQLEEACQMMDTLYGQGGTTRIVINHLCKPNLRLEGGEEEEEEENGIVGSQQPEFVQWKACIERMAAHPLTYMKLSGLFSELPPQTVDEPGDVGGLVARIRPWAQVVWNAFTPNRIMFGSDWPVCNAGGPGSRKSWQHWHQVVTALLNDLAPSEADLQRVWSGTAAEAYQIYRAIEN